MVELPEAAVLAEQVNKTLIGKRIINAVANHTPHSFAWYTGDPARYGELLMGKTIRGALAYGGHIEIKADDMRLLITTPLRYHAAGEKLPKKHQLLLEFDDASALSATVQMWGSMFCFKEGDTSGIPSCYKFNRSCPDPLSDSFDMKYFNSLLDERTRKMSSKAFLATEQRIPGLGNGVLQDILWRAKIHPKRKIESLSAGEIEDMYRSVKEVLKQMTAKGGRDTERDLFGNQGGYKTILCKDTADMPCPVCGTYIRKEAYLGGSIYFCGSCQKL